VPFGRVTLAERISDRRARIQDTEYRLQRAVQDAERLLAETDSTR